MTRYRSPVASPLLDQIEFAQRHGADAAEGFRLISVDGISFASDGSADVWMCTFEDDNAPPELEGKLVEPALQRTGHDPAVIVERRVIEE